MGEHNKVELKFSNIVTLGLGYPFLPNNFTLYPFLSELKNS
jgi:hypothetical protein